MILNYRGAGLDSKLPLKNDVINVQPFMNVILNKDIFTYLRPPSSIFDFNFDLQFGMWEVLYKQECFTQILRTC